VHHKCGGNFIFVSLSRKRDKNKIEITPTMKKLLTLSVLFISTLSYGQREMAEALKSDHVALLNQNINESNKDNCIEIKGSE
jgi:hypothetical protein